MSPGKKRERQKRGKLFKIKQKGQRSENRSTIDPVYRRE